MTKRFVGLLLLGCVTALGEPIDQTAATNAEPRALGLTLFWENDGAYTNPINYDDRWYSSGNGFAIQWQGPDTTELLSSLPSVGGEFHRDQPGVSYAGGLVMSLNIYTPEEIRDRNIRPNDRPYAGWTYAGLIVQRANRASPVPTYEHVELDIGVMGSMSRAGDVQKWVHKEFEQPYPEAWQYEVQNELGADLKYQRRWRHDLMRPSRPTGPAMQLIPDAGVTLGTIHTHAAAGATLRFGWNLPDDFGPGTMRHADDFTRPPGRDAGLARGISGYFFVRPGGRFVLHDATFGESLFRDDNPVSVETKPLVGEITAGATATFLRHWRLTYAHTCVTKEFRSQEEWSSYGSWTLSLVHSW